VPNRARAQNYPTQQNKQRIVRGYSWQLLGVDWPLLSFIRVATRNCVRGRWKWAVKISVPVPVKRDGVLALRDSLFRRFLDSCPSWFVFSKVFKRNQRNFRHSVMITETIKLPLPLFGSFTTSIASSPVSKNEIMVILFMRDCLHWPYHFRKTSL